jgi:hypothetical protein
MIAKGAEEETFGVTSTRTAAEVFAALMKVR